MTKEETFWAAIDEAPDDMGLRGIFADWLEERGGEYDIRLAAALRASLEPHGIFLLPQETPFLHWGKERISLKGLLTPPESFMVPVPEGVGFSQPAVSVEEMLLPYERPVA